MNQNTYSHLTAIERDRPSFPLRFLLERNLLNGNVLDFGCGFGKDVAYLNEKGITATGFDPHYFPNLPKEKFDVIVCFYVLNVLFEEEQNEVLIQISSMLKPDGRAYFAVRRDIKNDGFRTHYVHKKPTYQCQVLLPFKSIFRNENAEFYEYQPYNQLQFEASTCPFCKPKPAFKLIAESRSCYAILSPYPESKGHTLILPKRHVESYFALSFSEQKDAWQLVNFCKSELETSFQPGGYQVETKIGDVAKQRVKHAKIHLKLYF
jgi:diadenosine tetraphosphate (Ap4A) HIT family hydrolase